MARFKNKTVYLHREGLVSHSDAPDYSFLYEISTIKDAKWNVGDRVFTGDGKGFVYCKSGAACYTGLGNIFYNAIPATGIDYALLVAAQAIGDKQVKMTCVVAIAEDELVGGSILLKTADDSNDSALQPRGIVGNTAGAIGAVITIYLDAPLTGALTTASYGYCMPSPFSDVRWSENESLSAYCSHVGFANTYVSTAGYYHWEQFAGRRMGISLNATPGGAGSAHKRELVFRYQGSLQIRGTTAITGLNEQYAGYIVDNNTALNGATEVMLNINL